MGCCTSVDGDVPDNVSAEVYGQNVPDMPLGRFFPYVETPASEQGPALSAPKRPPLPKPNEAGRQFDWFALELGYQWSPKGPVRISQGEKPWTKKAARWFNGALLAPSALHVCCGREEVLFAGLMAKPSLPGDSSIPGCAVMSTGRIFILVNKKPLIKCAYHVFDLKTIKAWEFEGAYKVALEFSDMFPDGPRPLSDLHRSSSDVNLIMVKRQATDLITTLRRVGLTLMSSQVQIDAPDGLQDRISLPQAPCDGGFLAVFFATCNYFCVPLLSLKLGTSFFAGVPLLELDISELQPLNAQVAAAVRTGLQRATNLRALVRRRAEIRQEAWEHLLPVFKRGTLLKVHLPHCGLRGDQLSQLAKALVVGGHNYVLDLDLSGNEFDGASTVALSETFQATPGSLRHLNLADCRLPAQGASALLDALSKKCSKLSFLSLARNSLGAQPDPHPLIPIWASGQLEVLDLANTGVNLEKLLSTVVENQVHSIRELDISNLAFPPNNLAQRFFGFLGPKLERLGVAGLAQNSQQLGLVLAALGKTPKPNLDLDLSSSSPEECIAGVSAAVQKGQTPFSGLTLCALPQAKRAVQIFQELEPAILKLYAAEDARGVKGGQAHQNVHGKALQLLQAKAPEHSHWSRLGGSLASLGTTRLKLGGASGNEVVTVSLTAGADVLKMGQLPARPVGSGPPLAMMMAGLAKNTKVLELDLTHSLGGDAVAAALGAALKENRTLRSVKIEGNFFSHCGLSAVRGALYGNKRLMGLPFPEADVRVMLTLYQTAMQEREGQVLQCRGRIKAAYKRTKGARTPQVLGVQNQEVENIKVHKVLVARARGIVQKYAKLQQEIQEAIQRNQKDPKNLEVERKLREKETASSWKAAGRALNTIAQLEQQKKTATSGQEYQLWKARKEISEMWVSKCQELRTKRKDVEWLERWQKDNTKSGNSVVATGEAVEALLRAVPAQLTNDVKNEVKRSKDFIKSEEGLLASQQTLNSKIQAQKLEVTRLQASPSWRAPPTNGTTNLNVQQAKVLQQPLLRGSAAPPPNVVRAKVVQGVIVGQGGAYQANEQPVIAQVVGAVPPSAAVQNSQYDSFQVYQQQQQTQQVVMGTVLQQKPPYQQPYQPQQPYHPGAPQQPHQPGQPVYQPGMGGQQPFGQPPHYGGQPYGQPYGGQYGQPYGPGAGGYYQPHTMCMPNKKNDAWKYAAGGAAAGLGVGMLGMYMYNWHHWHTHSHYGHGYYGDDVDYSDDHQYDDCDWAQEYHVEEATGEWDTMLDEAPPNDFVGAEVGAASVADAGEAVDMYAGGEDDRPGRGPHSGHGSHAARVEVEPARTDLREWFEEKIRNAEQSAREAVLGREGPLPCGREVFVRTAHHSDGEEMTEGICLVTQCSLDRLGRLEEQLVAWEGEVSAAVYVDAAPGTVAAVNARQAVLETCARAAAARGESAALPLWTIVAVFQLEQSEVRCEAYDRLYPVNTLRNAALAAARAALVFLLDVDFVPSAGLHSLLCGGDDGGRRLRAALQGGRAPVALVVPAFEATTRKGRALPRDGGALRREHELGEVEGFHVQHFPKGHGATNFERWLGGRSGAPAAGRLVQGAHGVDAYPVEYEEYFEPYIVAERARLPAYDERFRGYGLNKVSHLYAAHACGFAFCVAEHPDAFVVAAKHEKSQSWRVCRSESEQRARLATHWASFKAELRSCFGPTASAATKHKVLQQLEQPRASLPSMRPTLCARTAGGLLGLLRSEESVVVVA